LKTLELLQNYADLMDELWKRHIVRTMNNPVAGFAEYLTCKALSLTPANNSEKGFDATGPDGAKYEIKSRRIAKGNSRAGFSAIRDIEGHHFDFLIAIIFESDFKIKSAWQIPYQLVKDNSRLQTHTNGWILHYRESSWVDSTVIDLTLVFIDALAKEIT
ncbi:MAG: hypothetical protein M1511_04935, partial [Deltaproteobacteria bacterium]|nr:hypothetical protein [Deltaproteobacteria bacterium]